MALPDGATKAVYGVYYYNGDVYPSPPVHVETILNVEVPLEAYPTELNGVLDGLIAGAMTEFRDYVAAHYPEAIGGVSRQYERAPISGDPWPTD